MIYEHRCCFLKQQIIGINEMMGSLVVSIDSLGRVSRDKTARNFLNILILRDVCYSASLEQEEQLFQRTSSQWMNSGCVSIGIDSYLSIISVELICIMAFLSLFY